MYRSQCSSSPEQTRANSQFSIILFPRMYNNSVLFYILTSSTKNNSLNYIMSKYIKLVNGSLMPKVGLGTWLVKNSESDQIALEKALEIGYRHFDTAAKYQNEEVLGRALKKWLDSGKGKREDLFIVTKLPWIAMQPERVEQFIKLSLKKLQLDYIDLYLIHWPFGLTYDTEENIAPMKDGKLHLDLESDILGVWKAMELQVESGKAKSIGLSNFNTDQIERVIKIAKIPPANLQVEVQAYFQQKELRQTCSKYNISVVAYGPLGSPGRVVLELNKDLNKPSKIPPLMEDEVVTGLAKKYSKSPAQILLRFLTQLGIAVIPKSTNEMRMTENFEIFGFEITPDDMKLLEALDKGETGRSFNEFPTARSHPEFPF